MAHSRGERMSDFVTPDVRDGIPRCKHTTFVVKGGTCTCLSCGHKWDDWKVWPRD